MQFEHLKVGMQAESIGLRSELESMRANLNAAQEHVAASATEAVTLS